MLNFEQYLSFDYLQIQNSNILRKKRPKNAYYKYLNQASASASPKLKSWDFGGGYQIVQNPNGEAEYYSNGNRISAYNFLTGTAGGNNWNKWNDVWNNGVSTRGVGSDTISGINNFMKTGNYDSRYNYLRNY